MINCEITKQLLSDYISGLTSDEINTEISAHLDECEECRQIYEEMKQISESAEQLDRNRPFEKIKKTMTGLKKRVRIAFAITFVFAAVFIIFAIGALFPQTGLPSVTRLKYKCITRDITKQFCEGNVEKVLQGIIQQGSSTYFDEKRTKNQEIMFSDYQTYIPELISGVLGNRSYSIGFCKLNYLGNNMYQASICVTLDDKTEYTIDFVYSNENSFWFSFSDDSSNEADTPSQVLANRLTLFQLSVIPNELGNTLFESTMLTPNGPDFDAFIEGYGSTVFSTHLSDDFSYEMETEAGKIYTEQLLNLKRNCNVTGFSFKRTGYSCEKHTPISTLYFEFEDCNKNKAIYTKEFFLINIGVGGNAGYAPVDSSYSLFCEGEFDEALRTQLDRLFIIDLDS